MIILKGAGNSRDTDISIHNLPYLLGRKETGLIQLIETSTSFAAGLTFLSRKHATIYMENGDVLIRDEGSLNGTEVNGKPLGQQGIVLHHGDNLVFAGKLRFVFEDDSERKACNPVQLEIACEADEYKLVELSTFPLIIGQSTEEPSLQELIGKELLDNVPGNILRIYRENGGFFVEELGCGIDIQLDGKTLSKRKESFDKGGCVEIASKLRVKFPASTLEADKFRGDEKNFQKAVIDGSLEDQQDQTVYMESPTQFIKVVTGEKSDGKGLDQEKDDETPVVQRKPFPLKTLLYMLLLLVLILSAWGGIHYYTHSGIQKAQLFVAEGKNQAALALVEEKLKKNPNHKTASALLFQITAKEYMTKYASYVLNGDLGEARAMLERSRSGDRYNDKIKKFNDLLQLCFELSEVVSAPDNYEVNVNWTDKYTSIHHRWTADVMENRSILEELAAIDTVFIDLRKIVYGKMNALRLIVNRKVPVIATFQKQLQVNLENNAPEKILSLLEDNELLKDVNGMDVYRDDLEHYLEFNTAVMGHDAGVILAYLQDPKLRSDIFLSHYRKRVSDEIPEAGTLATLSRAEEAWNDGQSRKAIAVMRDLHSSVWQEYLDMRLSHMERVSAEHERLVSQKGIREYPRALMKFRSELTPGRDGFFEIFAEREAEKVRKTLQVEYDNLFSQFKAKWESYLNGGRISTIQRMENEITQAFTQQAGRLLAAFDAYEQSQLLVDSFNLTPARDMSELGQKLAEEVIFQRQMVADLQMVLSRNVYEGKMQLLPKNEM